MSRTGYQKTALDLIDFSCNLCTYPNCHLPFAICQLISLIYQAIRTVCKSGYLCSIPSIAALMKSSLNHL